MGSHRNTLCPSALTIGLALLLSSCGQTPLQDLAPRVRQMTGRGLPRGIALVIPAAANSAPRVARRPERPVEYARLSSALAPTDWPTFRGQHRDGVSLETGLARTWPPEGPKLAWIHRDLGHGYSGPAIVRDTVYILGTVQDQEAAIALDLATGRRRWTTPLGPIFQNPWGNGPRSTPTVDAQRLYVLTPAGRLAALSIHDGKVLWSRSLEQDFDGEAPEWGYSESPLIDGEQLIVTPGLEHAMIALNKQTGDLIWQSSGFDDGAQYSSALVARVGGQDLYLNMTDRGLVGVSAKTGELMLRYEKTKNGTAACTMPVVRGDCVYTTSGFGAGCGLVRLTPSASSATCQELYSSTIMKNQHGGVVLLDGSLFGYSDHTGWLCHDFASGELRWSDKESLPKGSLIAADGRLYCVSERDGTTVLLEPSMRGWSEKGRLFLSESTRLGRGKGGIWTHPVISHGRLFVRDQELLFAFDIQAK